MHLKFFRYDKNYLLRAVQEELRSRLLAYLCGQGRRAFQQHFNPLGLEDSLSRQIRSTRPRLDGLQDVYTTLAAIYRYHHGGNQLELLFNGKSHEEQYHLDWSLCFADWCSQLCADPVFVRLLLGISVLQPPKKGHPSLAEQRLRSLVQEKWGIKVHKRRGILEQTA
ncbi:hypothetical protein [Cesiribacter andamanensis]|nr:hypothetical protein [Cesiribacter andamanensis]